MKFWLISGILYSEDNGTNWSWINEYGLANVPVNKLVLNGDYVYAFSHGRGVYRTVMTTSGTGDWIGSTISSTIWADGDGVGMQSSTQIKSGKVLGMWIIVGISVGGGAAVVVIVVVSVVMVRRKNRKRSESQEQILR